MLPSLTVTFIVGLFVGSQIPYLPLSASFFLFLSALVACILERISQFSVSQTSWLYGARLVGVVYWSVAVNGVPPDRMVEQAPGVVINVTGRIVAPVQPAPDR